MKGGALLQFKTKQMAFVHSANYKYSTFISYSHEDSNLVYKMQKELESFNIPKTISSTYGVSKIRAYLDKYDQKPEELQSGLYKGIDNSERLLFVSSPSSLASEYCQAELLHYYSTRLQGKKDSDASIIFVIVEGQIQDHFQKIRAILGIDPDNSEFIETLAIDWRPQVRNNNWKHGLYKILASLIGCEPDELARRHKAAKRKQLFAIGLAALLVTSITGSLMLSSMRERNNAKSSEASRLVTEAQNQLAEGDRISAVKTVLNSIVVSPKQSLIPEGEDLLQNVLEVYSKQNEHDMPMAIIDNYHTDSYITYLAVSDDGLYVAFFTDVNQVIVINTETSELIYENTFEELYTNKSSVKFHQHIMYFCNYHTLLAFNCEDKKEIWRIEDRSIGFSFVLSDDGERIIVDSGTSGTDLFVVDTKNVKFITGITSTIEDDLNRDFIPNLKMALSNDGLCYVSDYLWYKYIDYPDDFEFKANYEYEQYYDEEDYYTLVLYRNNFSKCDIIPFDKEYYYHELLFNGNNDIIILAEPNNGHGEAQAFDPGTHHYVVLCVDGVTLDTKWSVDLTKEITEENVYPSMYLDQDSVFIRIGNTIHCIKSDDKPYVLSEETAHMITGFRAHNGVVQLMEEDGTYSSYDFSQDTVIKNSSFNLPEHIEGEVELTDRYIFAKYASDRRGSKRIIKFGQGENEGIQYFIDSKPQYVAGCHLHSSAYGFFATQEDMGNSDYFLDIYNADDLEVRHLFDLRKSYGEVHRYHYLGENKTNTVAYFYYDKSEEFIAVNLLDGTFKQVLPSLSQSSKSTDADFSFVQDDAINDGEQWTYYIEKYDVYGETYQTTRFDIVVSNPDTLYQTHLMSNPTGRKAVFTFGDIGEDYKQAYIVDLETGKYIPISDYVEDRRISADHFCSWNTQGTQFAANTQEGITVFSEDGDVLHKYTGTDSCHIIYHCNNAIVASSDSVLYVLDSASNNILSEHELYMKEYVVSATTTYDDRIIVTTTERTLVIDQETGKQCAMIDGCIGYSLDKDIFFLGDENPDTRGFIKRVRTQELIEMAKDYVNNR